MKKEIAAAVLLILIFVLTAANSRYLETFTGEIADELYNAARACGNEDWDTAMNSASLALEGWTKHLAYTQVVMQHGVSNQVVQQIYELQGHIAEKDAGSGTYCALQIAEYLGNLAQLENVHAGSVF